MESALLGAVGGSQEHFLQIAEAGIEADDFTTWAEVYRFMTVYLEQYGSLPSTQQLTQRFNNFQPVPGDFRYWLTELARYTQAAKAMDAIRKAWDAMSDPQRAISQLMDSLAGLQAGDSFARAIDADTVDRLNLFRNRQEYMTNGAIMGIRTALGVIDKTHMGWMPGELIGIYARPMVGKTWMIVWQAAQAWALGKRVLVYTPEVVKSQLALRLDVMLSRMMGFPISHRMLMEGRAEIQANYEAVLAKIENAGRLWVYDNFAGRSAGLADINALVRRHRPDILLIDGISLLRSDSRRQTWEQIRDLSYGLKNIATVHEIPIIVSTQASNSGRGRRTESPTGHFLMPSMDDVAFGDSFAQACDTLITMCGDQATTYLRWYSLRKVRERSWSQDIPMRMGLIWDVDTGLIQDVSELGYNQVAVIKSVEAAIGIRQPSS